MTQVCLNKNAAFLYRLGNSTYLFVFKLNTVGQKFKILTEFWTDFPDFGRT